MHTTGLRAAALVAVAALALVGLSGCLDQGFPGDPTSSHSPEPSDTPSSNPTPSVRPSSPAPSSSPSAEPATPIGLSCEDLISLQALYEVSPNYALVPVTSASSGSLAAQAIADRGVACEIVHTSSGLSAFLSGSQPSAAALDRYQSSAGSWFDLGVAGVDAYAVGLSLQAFSATRRYTAETGSDFDPDDLTALLRIAASNG